MIKSYMFIKIKSILKCYSEKAGGNNLSASPIASSSSSSSSSLPSSCGAQPRSRFDYFSCILIDVDVQNVRSWNIMVHAELQTWCNQLMRRLPRGCRQPVVVEYRHLLHKKLIVVYMQMRQEPRAEGGQHVQTDQNISCLTTVAISRMPSSHEC